MHLYGESYEFPLRLGESVEFIMTVDELLKTDKMFQVMCDLTCPVQPNIPLVSLKGNKLLFRNPT